MIDGIHISEDDGDGLRPETRKFTGASDWVGVCLLCDGCGQDWRATAQQLETDGLIALARIVHTAATHNCTKEATA